MIRSTILAAAAALTLTMPARADVTGREAAGMMMSVVIYAQKNCPELKLNGHMMMDKMKDFGIAKTEDIDNPDSARRMRETDGRIYQFSPATVCNMIWDTQGEKGTVMPGLFSKK